MVAPWAVFVAQLMITSIATFSWASLRSRPSWRIVALAGVALLGAALLTDPWLMLTGVAALYLVMIPFSVASYARVRRLRACSASRGADAAPANAG